jgi:hypothetical protein
LDSQNYVPACNSSGNGQLVTLRDLNLKEYLNKVCFVMKNPRVEEQPDYPSVIRDTFYYMRVDESEKDGSGLEKKKYSRLYLLAEQFSSKGL